MKLKSTRAKNRTEAYRRYAQKVDAGYQNPLDPAGPRHGIHATHIDRFGLRYDLSPIKRIQDALDLRNSGRDAPEVSVPFYRPSRRQSIFGCDACGLAHVPTNVYCVVNPHCVRVGTRLDPESRFKLPSPNSGQIEILYSLVPGRYPTYKASILELHIIGKRKSGRATLEFLTRSVRTSKETEKEEL